jgi:hypothetical protein
MCNRIFFGLCVVFLFFYMGACTKTEFTPEPQKTTFDVPEFIHFRNIAAHTIYLQEQSQVEDFENLFVEYIDANGNLNANLFIMHNVTDLSALSKLNSIAGYLIVAYTDNLVDLKGLDGLSSIGDGIYIYYNSGLEEVNGLDKLTSVQGELSIFNNTNLKRLKGFSKVTKIDSNFVFSANPLLSSMEGLKKLESIGGNFYLAYHPQLANLGDFKKLREITGGITVYNNTGLTNCCDIYPIIAANPSQVINISQNGFGCSSVTEILDNCK